MNALGPPHQIYLQVSPSRDQVRLGEESCSSPFHLAFLVSGPVFSIALGCVAVAQKCNTPRDRNFFFRSDNRAFGDQSPQLRVS